MSLQPQMMLEEERKQGWVQMKVKRPVGSAVRPACRVRGGEGKEVAFVHSTETFGYCVAPTYAQTGHKSQVVLHAHTSICI